MIRPKRLVDGSTLTTSAVTYYTAPANTRTIIKRITFTNTLGSASTVTLYIVPSGGSAGVTNIIAENVAIADETTWSCTDAEGQVLEAGGTIQALAGDASAVNIIASGVEVT